VSLNLEQQLAEGLGLFARAGWSQGQFEAFDFTDINTTISLGLSINGVRWGRPDDTAGVAIAVNGASGDAKQFFAAGGLGILVGDGQLLHSGLSTSWRPITAWQSSHLPSYRSTINLWIILPITAIAGRCRFSVSAPMGSFDGLQVRGTVFWQDIEAYSNCSPCGAFLSRRNR
jgi:Carbohydrate-selective porin, OprB family